ncbi:MAG: hypothetical protein AAFR87_35775, partial [Bacteroidota bacterium]
MENPTLQILKGDQINYFWICVISDHILYAGGNRSRIDQWNYRTGEIIAQFEIPESSSTTQGIFYEPKNWLIVASALPYSLFIDIESNQIVGKGLQHSFRVAKNILLSKHLLASGDTKNTIRFCNLEQRIPTRKPF